MNYVFKDAEATHRLLWMQDQSQLAAQCKLPIGTWSCLFKDDDGTIYNANSDNTFTRIN